MALNFSVMRQASLFNTGEQSFLENAGVFLASVIDTEGVDAWFQDDLQYWGVYKSIVLKRYKHTTGATEQLGVGSCGWKTKQNFFIKQFWSSAQLSIDFCGSLCNFVCNLLMVQCQAIVSVLI